MGSIVAACATSHVLGAPDGVEAQAERVFQGMREIGRRIREARPDVLLVITSDHLNNFHADRPEPFAVSVDAWMTPYGDMGLPREPIPGAAGFAQGFADLAATHGLKVTRVRGIKPDHGVMIPHAVVDPQRSLPTAILYVNSVLSPAPSPSDCYALGGLLKRYIETIRPDAERVALLAGGGLSHWLGVPQEGQVNVDWDLEFLRLFTGGEGARLAQLGNAEILEQAGNGGLEVSAWLTLAGATPGATGETIYYEAMPSWASGMAGAALHVG